MRIGTAFRGSSSSRDGAAQDSTSGTIVRPGRTEPVGDAVHQHHVVALAGAEAVAAAAVVLAEAGFFVGAEGGRVVGMDSFVERVLTPCLSAPSRLKRVVRFAIARYPPWPR
jgi:hypothetical protein